MHDHLVHHLLVDVQPPGGVEEHEVRARDARVRDPLEAQVGRLLSLPEVDRDVDLAAEHAQLLHGRRALDVGRDQQRAALVLLAQVLRQLGAGGGLARALEPRHQDDGRPGLRELEARVLGPEELHELFVERVDELRARVDARDALQADHARPHPVGEVLDDLVVDVGLEQRLADLPQTLLDVLLRQLLLPAQEREGLGEPLGERFEHGSRRSPQVRGCILPTTRAGGA